MPFSQADIIQVYPPQYQGAQVFISWDSSATPGSVYYQIYIDLSLAWWGLDASTWLPIEPGTHRIDIGYVDPGEEQTDFSAGLSPTPPRRAELSWIGGYWEGSDLAGFHVYGAASPGGAISYTTPLATITAYPGGIDTSGWGLGGWGLGGWGSAGGSYSWTSETLASGTWSFAVKPFDSAGNEGIAQFATVIISAPPSPPAVLSDGVTRLSYTLLGWGQIPWGNGGWGDPEAVLTWGASTS